MAVTGTSNIPLFYVFQFSSNIQLKLQQKGSVLRETVMSGNHVGAQASPVDQFGSIVANKVTGRYNPMPRTDAPTDRRWVFPQDYDVSQLLDTFDKLRLLTDPLGSYVTNATYALGRAIDSEIISGIVNNNFTGNTGGTPTGFLAANEVSVQQGATSPVNMTVAKLRYAKRLLLSYYAEVFDEPIYCIINAANHDALLAETQVINGDYNDSRVLVKGRVMEFLGINFVHTELLTTGTDDQSGTSTMCPLYMKSGVYLGIWEDTYTSISQRHDLQSEPYQAYNKCTIGGTRLEEKKVTWIWNR
jgi:capsid protein